MTFDNMEPEVSEKSMKTAKQVASSFCRRLPGSDFQEVLAEAYLIMLEAVGSWEPDKGRSLQSWIGFLVHRELKKRFKTYNNIIYVEDIDLLVETPDNNNFSMFGRNPEQMLLEKERLFGLSQLSVKIMNMLFDGSLETKSMSRNLVKREIKTKLRKHGIAFNKIQAAFKEIRMAVTA